MENKYAIWFEDIKIGDIPLVGGKNASLGEMYSKLKSKGIQVPNGFAITSEAYRYFITFNKLDDEIRRILSDLDTGNMKNLSERGYKIRQLILASKFPEDLEEEIIQAITYLLKKMSAFNMLLDKLENESKILYKQEEIKIYILSLY